MSGIRSLPRSARLLRPGEFRAVIDRGEAFPGREVLVRCLRRPDGEARLGIAAPSGYGGAVRRNRLRRLVREAFRAQRGTLGPVDVLVSPRRGLREPTLAGIASDLARLRTARPAPRQRAPAAPPPSTGPGDPGRPGGPA